jgi:hypothetical protein
MTAGSPPDGKPPERNVLLATASYCSKRWTGRACSWCSSAAGQSNQGIASGLVVSLDTVKKHVSHLLGKLGAANRTEAVARGRELGLID